MASDARVSVRSGHGAYVAAESAQRARCLETGMRVLAARGCLCARVSQSSQSWSKKNAPPYVVVVPGFVCFALAAPMSALSSMRASF
eukprot:1080153-Pleurochrysis_carterae.AAC.2